MEFYTIYIQSPEGDSATALVEFARSLSALVSDVNVSRFVGSWLTCVNWALRMLTLPPIVLSFN